MEPNFVVEWLPDFLAPNDAATAESVAQQRNVHPKHHTIAILFPFHPFFQSVLSLSLARNAHHGIPDGFSCFSGFDGDSVRFSPLCGDNGVSCSTSSTRSCSIPCEHFRSNHQHNLCLSLPLPENITSNRNLVASPIAKRCAGWRTETTCDSGSADDIVIDCEQRRSHTKRDKPPPYRITKWYSAIKCEKERKGTTNNTEQTIRNAMLRTFANCFLGRDEGCSLLDRISAVRLRCAQRGRENDP